MFGQYFDILFMFLKAFLVGGATKKCLLSYGILDEDECKMAGKVLDAAALTYVASFFSSLLYFLRFVIIASSYRRNK